VLFNQKIISLNKTFILTKGCLVSQCLKTFKTLIVEAVLTIVYSFAFCSLEFGARGLLFVDDCGDAEGTVNIIYMIRKRNLILPGVLPNRSCLLTLGVSPDVATANACVAAAELVRRRDDRDDVTTTPGKTFFNEPSAALRKL